MMFMERSGEADSRPIADKCGNAHIATMLFNPPAKSPRRVMTFPEFFIDSDTFSYCNFELHTLWARSASERIRHIVTALTEWNRYSQSEQRFP